QGTGASRSIELSVVAGVGLLSDASRQRGPSYGVFLSCISARSIYTTALVFFNTSCLSLIILASTAYEEHQMAQPVFSRRARLECLSRVSAMLSFIISTKLGSSTAKAYRVCDSNSPLTLMNEKKTEDEK
ncbi:hypothetical protein GCK32_006949, partial [Trichostrongylus colubriformis]